MSKRKKVRLPRILFLVGLIVGAFLIIGIEKGAQLTSTDAFCESCHIHPHSTQTWKTSPHYDNAHGVYVHCVDCHLPPKTSFRYYTAKATTGARDVWGKLFKDPESLNWEEKSTLEHAVKHTYEESCKKCHQNLFPIGLSEKGEKAHLYYDQNEETVNCLNCHLRVGHYSHEEQHAEEYKIEVKSTGEIFTKPAVVTSFENYTEFIPGSSVKFDMIAIPGGSFKMGSPDSEAMREEDEGPQVTVNVSSFWMAKAELSWAEFDAFYAATAKEGRSDTRTADDEVDGITGPTPPYENPDQGWGRGSRPALTFTYHTAKVYCQWLSEVTGKTYRLPTEAEWEYACRAGTDTPYFFEGDPKKYSTDRFWNKIFGVDTTNIVSFANYRQNSFNKTVEADAKKPNPFGLLNMTGNAWEFCADWYAPDTYASYSDGIQDPTGPASGTEHVIRGGSYKSDAGELRSAARASTNHKAWMVTDPQMPKSTWWYSDSKDVSFRVVCEYNEQ
jgi:cytochrome c nitrite reductase small subunit